MILTVDNIHTLSPSTSSTYLVHSAGDSSSGSASKIPNLFVSSTDTILFDPSPETISAQQRLGYFPSATCAASSNHFKRREPFPDWEVRAGTWKSRLENKKLTVLREQGKKAYGKTITIPTRTNGATTRNTTGETAVVLSYYWAFSRREAISSSSAATVMGTGSLVQRVARVKVIIVTSLRKCIVFVYLWVVRLYKML